MSKLATLFIALSTACVTDTAETPVATRVFDFSPRPLDASELSTPGSSAKSQLRATVDRVLPPIAACIDADRAGAIALTFTLTFDDDVASVESATADAFGDANASGCVREALLALDTSLVSPPPVAERWTIHAPLYTGTR